MAGQDTPWPGHPPASGSRCPTAPPSLGAVGIKVKVGGAQGFWGIPAQGCSRVGAAFAWGSVSISPGSGWELLQGVALLLLPLGWPGAFAPASGPKGAVFMALAVPWYLTASPSPAAGCPPPKIRNPSSHISHLQGGAGWLGCWSGVPMPCSGHPLLPSESPRDLGGRRGPSQVPGLCQPRASPLVVTSRCVSLRAGEMPARFGAAAGHPHLQQDGQEGQLCPHLRLQGPLSARYRHRCHRRHRQGGSPFPCMAQTWVGGEERLRSQGAEHPKSSWGEGGGSWLGGAHRCV